MLPPIALPTEIPTGNINSSIDNIQAPPQRISMHVTSMSTPPTDNAVVTIDQKIRHQIAKALRLNELLDNVNPENSHDEVFNDGPVGHEEW
ncbi:MAG TPA: hypothetical protein VEO74_02280 [Thermoanaerobaculia bacterium]|nr:hypothetical protein [Thermoanaerobaculia bacterium]